MVDKAKINKEKEDINKPADTFCFIAPQLNLSAKNKNTLRDFTDIEERVKAFHKENIVMIQSRNKKISLSSSCKLKKTFCTADRNSPKMSLQKYHPSLGYNSSSSESSNSLSSKSVELEKLQGRSGNSHITFSHKSTSSSSSSLATDKVNFTFSSQEGHFPESPAIDEVGFVMTRVFSSSPETSNSMTTTPLATSTTQEQSITESPQSPDSPESDYEQFSSSLSSGIDKLDPILPLKKRKILYRVFFERNNKNKTRVKFCSGRSHTILWNSSGLSEKRNQRYQYKQQSWSDQDAPDSVHHQQNDSISSTTNTSQEIKQQSNSSGKSNSISENSKPLAMLPLIENSEANIPQTPDSPPPESHSDEINYLLPESVPPATQDYSMQTLMEVPSVSVQTQGQQFYEFDIISTSTVTPTTNTTTTSNRLYTNYLSTENECAVEAPSVGQAVNISINTARSPPIATQASTYTPMSDPRLNRALLLAGPSRGTGARLSIAEYRSRQIARAGANNIRPCNCQSRDNSSQPANKTYSYDTMPRFTSAPTFMEERLERMSEVFNSWTRMPVCSELDSENASLDDEPPSQSSMYTDNN